MHKTHRILSRHSYGLARWQIKVRLGTYSVPVSVTVLKQLYWACLVYGPEG